MANIYPRGSDNMCSRKTFNLVNLIIILLLPVSSIQLVHAAVTIEQLLNEPYFNASDIETVRKGGFGVARIHEVSDREIAVVIACLVKGKPEDALAPFLGDALPVDEELLEDQQLIDMDFPKESFAAISLDSNDRNEVQHYLDAQPGFGLNLSIDEIAALQALKGADGPGQVESLLEDMLLA
ncbi:MAG: hypothetical protein EP297_04000, partial [Gammaproteobacteria bacterium]